LPAHPDDDDRLPHVPLTLVPARPAPLAHDLPIPGVQEAPLRFRDVRVIGPLADRLLLCEADGDLLVIDPWAARRRVLRHRLEHDVGAPPLPLAAPIHVELDRRQAASLAPYREALAPYISMEPLGQSGFVVTGIVGALSGVDVAAVLRDVARAGIDAMLPTLAHHGATRQGLEAYDTKVLLAELDEVSAQPRAPLLARISVMELERRLLRG